MRHAIVERLNPSPLHKSSASLPALAAGLGAVGRASGDAGAVKVDWQALLGGQPLQAAELLALQELDHTRWVGVGDLVFTRHQRATQLMAVLWGAVGLGLARDDEPFHLERTVRGPQWLDLASAWLMTEHAQDARALTEARVLELPLAQVRTLMQRQPALVERLLAALAGAVHSLTCVTHDLMHKDAERRLAAWLLQRCVEAGEGRALVTLSERKRDIAAQLAITPETLSRMMRQLNRKGLNEVQGYSIHVLDLAALQALARD